MKQKLKRQYKKSQKLTLKTVFYFFLFLLCTWAISTIRHPIFNAVNATQSWITLPKIQWKTTKTIDKSPPPIQKNSVKIIHTQNTKRGQQTNNKLMLHSTCQQSKTGVKALQKKLNKLSIHSQLRTQKENQHTCFYLSLGPYQDYPTLQRQQQILQKLKDSPSINIRR
ncbi:MAG: hypothetical protein VX737_05030 [Pseudomonadota bacterium]|nr:hypothetical protein [Pseudomonadota bacterium]